MDVLVSDGLKSAALKQINLYIYASAVQLILYWLHILLIQHLSLSSTRSAAVLHPCLFQYSQHTERQICILTRDSQVICYTACWLQPLPRQKPT